MPENNPISDAELAEVKRWLAQANQPYSAKLKAAKRDGQAMVTRLVPALLLRLEAAEREREEARKENDFMRLRLAESDKACVYCDLPKAEMGGCASGFPGCARADDLSHCDELTRRDAQQRRDGAADELERLADADMELRSMFLTECEIGLGLQAFSHAKLADELRNLAKRLREGGE